MAKVNVDTDKMREIGNNIISLSNEYTNVINELHNRLMNVSNTGEWSGVSADKFIEAKRLSKESYISLGRQLRRYGEVLVQSASDFEMSANRNIIG